MAKIIGKPLKNIPWEDKPQGYQYPVWRYSGNPIINRDDLFMSNNIFVCHFCICGCLCFYHGVTTSCNGFVYSMGAAIMNMVGRNNSVST